MRYAVNTILAELRDSQLSYFAANRTNVVLILIEKLLN